MHHQHHSKPAPDVPKWSALLVEAVNKPGLIMEAYSAFHNYSIGNQILALVQCQLRGLEPGPINTFPGWQALGRNVKRGERALVLCMPITCKRHGEGANDNNDEANGERTYTSFVYKPRWFVVSQTIGEELTPPTLPQWDTDRALGALDIEQILFTETDGNCQGYARKRQIAINPVAQLPHKTLFHEVAHVTLGHTSEADFTDTERTPKDLREVEAEAVAMLCCEALNLEGADYCRGYIQNWLYRGIGYNAEAIPRKERTEDSPRRRSNPASRTVTTERGRTRAMSFERRRLGLAQAPTCNPSRRKIDANELYHEKSSQQHHQICAGSNVHHTRCPRGNPDRWPNGN